MLDEVILETEEKMEKAIVSLETRFLNVRAGRANPNMLDKIKVEYYGSETPLQQLANISVPEARKLIVKPFDRTSIGAIEKAIFEANIGLTPNNNGETVILNIPELTEERRKDFVKQAKVLAEEAKIALRNIRQDSNNAVKKLEIAEDDQKGASNEIQELINKYNKVVDEKLKEKENELMSI
ncbi:MAG: ribosome recycling factor [Bacilli bacterium]